MLKCPKSCYDCGLGEVRDQQRERIVWGDIPKDKVRLVVVGEAPGAEEGATGRPFVGAAGKMLNELLREAGIDRNKIAVLNIVKCRPPDNRKPKPDEVQACSKYLVAQIKEIRPRVIVAMGNVPMEYFTGQKSGITHAHGTVRKATVGKSEYFVIPTMHPSYVMRSMTYDRKAFTDVVEDLKKAWDLAQSKQEEVKHEYFLTKTVGQVRQLEDYLDGVPWYAFDTETTGLDPRKSRILGISFSAAPFSGYYVPFWYPSPVDERLVSYWPIGERKQVLKLVRRILTNQAKKIGHNLQFDLRMVETVWKLRVPNVHFDTMLAAHLLDENSSVALGNLSDRYFVDLVGFKNKVRGRIKSTSEGMSNVPLKELWPYACGDADATVRLYLKFRKELKEQTGLLRVFREFSMPTCLTLVSMVKRGIALDMSHLGNLRRGYEKRYAKLLRIIEREAGFPVNPNGRKDMERLVSEIGVSLPKTKSGALSTSEGALAGAANQHPVLAKIVEARKVQKNLSTYVDGLGSRVSDDGRIRADFSQVFTVTGRLSCRNPNLQNIKRDTDLQNLFVARKGFKILYADYSQMELRVMSWYAQEPAMLEAWSTGIDFHQMTAAAIYHKKFKQVTKEERQIGKNMNFALTYGAGPMGLVHNFNVPIEQAQELYDRYFETFTQVAAWQNKTIDSCRKTGIVRNAFGRIRRIPTITSMERSVANHAQHQAVNSPVQSAASDICSRNMSHALDYCEEKGHGAGLVLTVHDTVMFEVPAKFQKQYMKDIQEILVQPVHPVDVPLRVDAKLVDRWGEVAG